MRRWDWRGAGGFGEPEDRTRAEVFCREPGGERAQHRRRRPYPVEQPDHDAETGAAL
jgi:hypothetical protein